MKEAELVGGALFYTEDPVAAAKILVELLASNEVDIDLARSIGVDPDLVPSLRRSLPSERMPLELICAEGAGWVMGRRSSTVDRLWEAVASLPQGVQLPPGLRRTTGETMIGMASNATNRIRLIAPYLDTSGMGFLVDAIVSATDRDVNVELFNPQSWAPAEGAIASLTDAIAERGNPEMFHLVHVVNDAPFAHLKVMVVDGTMAYIGSANITAAGLAGRNLELGVLVHGNEVQVIESVLDLFIDKNC